MKTIVKVINEGEDVVTVMMEYENGSQQKVTLSSKAYEVQQAREAIRSRVGVAIWQDIESDIEKIRTLSWEEGYDDARM